MKNIIQKYLLILIILTVSSIVCADYIWIEGEDAAKHTMKRHGWYDSVNKDSLSGSQWLSHFASGDNPIALYAVKVKTSGEYHFWIRANSVAGPKLSYQLDRGPWTEVNLKNAIENINIASDAKPDMRFISWINAGKVNLTAGLHRISFKFHSPNNNHGGLDCFVFTDKPFVPRGGLKPGARTSKANPGFFAWEPDTDLFTDDALIDLSYLNEDIAGQDGHIKAKGNDFYLANGQKVKFWAVNAGPGIWSLDDQSHIYLAKHLAKHGVNMVRLHGGVYGRTDPSVNPQRLKKLQHIAWAFKQEGIYTKISFYFPAWFRPAGWHKDNDKWPFMILFFDKQMQDIYFNWVNKILTTPNPYTKIPLGQDPAVAMVEIQNEDSHFFYTFNEKNARPDQWDQLKALYGNWLKKKYGSISKALATWKTGPIKGDDTTSGKMQLFGAWNMTTDGLKTSPKQRLRVSDQVAFLTENMRTFYSKAIDYFKTDCGYKGLVSCGNWHTADARTLDALERYCHTAGDVIDRHGYFDHDHKGDGASYSVRTGHTFESHSALHLKQDSPLPFVETDGYPSITTEIGWPMPNMYRAESAFLTASYGSLWGMDGIFHFAVGSSSWNQSVGKFILNNPVALGSYFASALVYRNQYVKEADPVVVEDLSLDDLLDLKGSKAYVRPALDQFRATQATGSRSSDLNNQVDPMAFYAGRVIRRFKDNSRLSVSRSLTDLINRKDKTITSITDELTWNYGNGVVTMNTPKAQGAAGFLGQIDPVELNDITVDMDNDYGTVMVVSMDGKPLAQSRKILIQCITIDQLYGWKTSTPGGMAGTIQNVGTAPWGIEKIKANVTLKGLWPKSTSVTICDENGYPTDKKTTADLNSDRILLRIDPTAAYTIITREQ